MARSRASAKKAGTSFETDSARYLSERTGLKITRLAKSGSSDKGDLTGVTLHGNPVAVECKNPGKNSSWNISEWWSETEAETINYGGVAGFLIVSAYRKGPSESVVFTDEKTWKIFGGPETPIVKMRGFSQCSQMVEEHGSFRSKRHGKDGHWVITTLESFIDFIDSKDSIPSAGVTREVIDTLVSEGEIVVPTSTGTPLLLKLTE